MARKKEILNDLPAKVVEKLLPFQLDGIYEAICKKGRCLIADEMGLGKTLQAIMVAYYYQSEWPALIIVPSSLKFAWIEELEKWLPEIQPNEINLVQAGNDVSGLDSTKITLVSYGLLNKKTSSLLLEALLNQKFKVVIADESHYIKNAKSVSSKVIVPIIKAANRRILISGTPALARPVELFPQLDALNVNTFGNFWEYTNRFCNPRYEYFGRKKIRKVDGASNLDELQKKLLETVMIRREKKDVLTQLPPKQRQRILFELKDSPIKKEIFSLFQQLKPKLEAMKKCCAPPPTGPANSLTDSSQSNSSFEILKSFQNLFKISGEAKIGPVQDYIKMLCANNNLKFIIFAYHHDMMDGISQTLWDLKVKFIRIDGSTHPSDRQTFVQQFQQDPETCVAVLSILAAGVGLTLTEAKMVVFAEMYWTPGVMIQCEDRAHRIGQTCSLPVHYLVAKGTMDEWMWSILNRKTGVVSTILDGQRKKLEAVQGNQDQIDILSNADMCDLNKSSDPIDISLMLQSEDPSDQKSILQFFQPVDSSNISLNSEKDKEEDFFKIDSLTSERKKEKIKSNFKTTSRQKRRNNSSDTRISRESPCKKIKLSTSPIRISDDSQDSEESDFTKLSSPKRKTKLTTSTKSNNRHEIQSKPSKTESPSRNRSIFGILESTRDDRSIKKTPWKNKKWSCPVCTFFNHKFLKVCEMCEIGKKDQVVQTEKSASNLKDESSFTSECDQSFNQKNTSSPCKDINNSITNLATTSQSPSSKNKFIFRKTWESNLEYSPILPKRKDFDSSFKTESLIDEQTVLENKSVLEDEQTVLEDEQTVLEDESVLEDETNGFNEERSINDQNKTDQGINFGENPSDSEQSSLTHEESKAPLEVSVSEPSLNQSIKEDNKSINLEDTVKYDNLMYCCSQFTSRLHLYDLDKNPLNINFLPEDIEMNNFSELPDFIKHPHNIKLIRRFVREWNSLTETKQRVICKQKLIFNNPRLAYEEIRCDKNFSLKRHLSKDSVAQSSLINAQKIQGSIRLISNKKMLNESNADLSNQKDETILNNTKGIVQALNSDGVPMCINCQKPFDNKLINEKTLKKEENAWCTRFCSYHCMDTYLMKTRQSYCREKLFQIEHGICQLCGLDAEALFKKIKTQNNMKKRVEILQSSQFNKLTSKQKESIVRNPSQGMFWQADHIKAVFEGGGQCDIDNYRTLCVLCHKKVTAHQTKQRAVEKKKVFATGTLEITKFFKVT